LQLKSNRPAKINQEWIADVRSRSSSTRKSPRRDQMLGFDVNDKRLPQEFRSRGTSVQAFRFTAVFEGQGFSSIRSLIDRLDDNGYSVITTMAKKLVDPRRLRLPQYRIPNIASSFRTRHTRCHSNFVDLVAAPAELAMGHHTLFSRRLSRRQRLLIGSERR
jgi:hypothetical protein